MSYEKAMKHARNPRKYKKAQPIIMHTASFVGAKSIWADQSECPKCGYDAPTVTIEDYGCYHCQGEQPQLTLTLA